MPPVKVGDGHHEIAVDELAPTAFVFLDKQFHELDLGVDENSLARYTLHHKGTVKTDGQTIFSVMQSALSVNFRVLHRPGFQYKKGLRRQSQKHQRKCN